MDAPNQVVDALANDDMEGIPRHPDDIYEETAMKESLECPICKDLPRDIYKEPVFNCFNGHIVCNDCLKEFKMTQCRRFDCPTCRIPWKPARNSVATRALKRHYRRRQVKCKNRTCPTTDYLAALQAGHEPYCVHRRLKCPSRFFNDCNWRGDVKELVEHLKNHKCVQVALNQNAGPEENPENIEFRGRFMNKPSNFFTLGMTQIIKPILLLSPSIARAFIWLQVERKASSQWHFTAWSLLSEDALKNVFVSLFIASPNKRAFGSKFNVMSALEYLKHEAINRGECEIKFDEQLKLSTDFSELAFDFVVTVTTPSEFRERLNHDSLQDIDLEKYIMDNLEGPREQRLNNNADDVAIDLHPMPAARVVTFGNPNPIEVRVSAERRAATPDSIPDLTDNDDDDRLLAQV